MVTLVPLYMFKHSGDFFCGPFQGNASFVDIFCFSRLSSLLLAAVWSPARKGLTSWLSCVMCFLMFVSLFHMLVDIRTKLEAGTVKHA